MMMMMMMMMMIERGVKKKKRQIKNEIENEEINDIHDSLSKKDTKMELNDIHDPVSKMRRPETTHPIYG